MSVNSVITHTCDLEAPLTITPLRHALASGDKLGDRFDVTVLRDGAAVDLTGAGVTGYFIRTADGATVVVTGTAAGSTASVTLPESCYAVPGRFTLTVKVALDNVRHTVYVGEGAVLRSATDMLVDPGAVVPSLEELLAQIARMEAATNAANAARDAANTAAQEAQTAAGAADAATEKANTAAQGADQAREAAAQAAEDATAAAESAETQAAAAKAAAARADTAAQAAETQAQAAETAAQGANAAAENAGAQAEAAAAAAGLANAAAQGANESAALAEAAAQNAGDKAAYIGGVTVAAHDVPSGDPATVEKTDVDGCLHLNFGLPEGKQGKPYTIKGPAYATVEALEAAVPDPAEGDQYNVGTEPPYNVYRWTGSAWEDQGRIQGPDGPQGTPGKDGISPHIDEESGNWFVGETDTGVKAQGEDGQPGPAGADGVTPHIDESSGNWYIGDKNTGIHAQGPQGIPGTIADIPYSNAAPKDLAAAAAAGTSTDVARADHAHKLPTAAQVGAVSSVWGAGPDNTGDAKPEVGGRNLLLNTNVPVTNSQYETTRYAYSEVPLDGETYTIQIKGKLGEGKTSFTLFDTIDSGVIARLTPDSLRDGIYTTTFVWRKYPETSSYLRVFAVPRDATSGTTIEWIKLERGSVPTDWTPAPDDMIGGRNLLLNSANLVLDKIAAQDREYGWIGFGNSYMDVPAGTIVTISFDLKMTVNTANPFLRVYNDNQQGPKQIELRVLNFTAQPGDVIEKRCYVTTVINDRTNPNRNDNFIEFYSNYDTKNWFRISNLKMERGIVPTDWSPAPEDLVPTSRTINGKALTGNITLTAADLSGTLAVAHGGTGATDAAGARKALGVPTFSYSNGTLTITT